MLNRADSAERSRWSDGFGAAKRASSTIPSTSATNCSAACHMRIFSNRMLRTWLRAPGQRMGERAPIPAVRLQSTRAPTPIPKCPPPFTRHPPRHPQHTTNGLNVESPFPPSDTIQLIRRPQTMAGKHVFYFGNGFAEGGRDDKQTLGGKGANLAEMTRIGVPVPPGFTISTDACRFYLREERYPPDLEQQVAAALERVEADTGKRFGGLENPLLLSVRSGAAISMPGMMDTILNLGLNDQTVEALARASNDERFAWDSYRRFVQMYSDVVLGVPASEFEERLEARKQERGVVEDTELEAVDLRALAHEFKSLVRERLGSPFPDDPQI